MPRFLIVDDSASARYLLTRFLGRFGQCREAVDGREAVRLFGRALRAGEPFDLVVMDIMMPRMDGHAAVARIRALEAKVGVADPVRVAMLSSLDDPRHIVRAQYESGSDMYLTKPVELRTLREMLVNLGLLDASPMAAGSGQDSGREGAAEGEAGRDSQ